MFCLTPLYILHSLPYHTYIRKSLHFSVVMLSLSLRCTRSFLDCIASFGIHFYAILPADVLAALTQSFHIGHHYIGFILLDLFWIVLLTSVLFLASDVSPIQGPYWVFANAECFIEVILFLLQQLFVGTDCLGPVFKGVNNTILGRQGMVTVPLQIQISVCVGFLYTDVKRELSGCGITIVSKKGRDPSDLASSVVNWMCRSMLLKCSKNFSFLAESMPTKVSSTYLFHMLGGYSAELMPWISPPYRGWSQMGLIGDPIAAPCSCS